MFLRKNMFTIIWACPRFSYRGQAVRFIPIFIEMFATILYAWQRGIGLRLFFAFDTYHGIKGWMDIGSSRFDLHQKKLTVQQAIQNFSQKRSCCNC